MLREIKFNHKNNLGDFPCGPVVKTLSSPCGRRWVQSLVGEIRSHMLQPKKKKKILKYKQTNKKEQFGEQQISTICIRSIRISFFFSKPPNIIESLVFARHCA